MFNLIEMHREEVGLTSLPGWAAFSFDEFRKRKVISILPEKFLF